MSPVQQSAGIAQERLTQKDFQWVRRTVYDFAGIDLEGKQVLVEARLGKQMRELNLGSFRKLHEYIESDKSGNSFRAMVDALTTNHTTFFREPQHFTFLRDLIASGFETQGTLRIWSAACSSGEEPYSIAFTLAETLGDAAHLRASILATDISTKMLSTAERGIYPAARFQKVPKDRMRKHLLMGVGSASESYRVKRERQALVQFERLNLMEDFSHVGLFSVIFCRNVMIYFDKQTQETLVNRLAERLYPGGYLFIGHAESLNGIQHPLQYIQPATYKRPEGARRISRLGATN